MDCLKLAQHHSRWFGGRFMFLLSLCLYYSLCNGFGIGKLCSDDNSLKPCASFILGQPFSATKLSPSSFSWTTLNAKGTRHSSLNDSLDGENRVVASISTNDIEGGKPRPRGSLGIPSPRNPRQKSMSERPLSKQDKQRTANGNIDSTKQSPSSSKDNEQIQVLEARRGSKIVTIVRGMTSPMEDRKVLLKTMKKKLGGGGSLIDGVLELQGSHSDKVVQMLKSQGYAKARKI